MSETDIRFIFDEFDTGKYSLIDFVTLLNQKGIKTISGRNWTKGNLHRFLTNPFYHGDFYYNGKIWPGKHKGYYDVNRYDERVQRLGNKFLRQVVDLIDTLRDMPVIYLQATREEKAEIIRSMAHGIIIREDAVLVLWKKPYSYLLKNEVLEYKKKLTTLNFENRQPQLPHQDSNYNVNNMPEARVG